MIVNAFSGAGGWEEGAKMLGFSGEVVGIEWMPEAVATARAAGHEVIKGSVAEPLPAEIREIVGFIASPPCQAFSSGGKRLGKHDLPIIYEALEFLLDRPADERHLPLPASFGKRCIDERSILVVEPLRWILATLPEWIALEQVPAVLPLWEWIVDLLRELGYSAWTGLLHAEEYGVPQTRKRAILIASRVRAVGEPEPTHQGYNARSKGPKRGTEDRLPYVTMADALGWTPEALVGFARLADDRGAAIDVDGTAYRERDLRPADAPAHHLTEKARSWSMVPAGQARNSGPGASRDPRSVADDPSYTIRAQGSGSHPSGVEWTAERPATTISGDPRVQPPGHKVNAEDLAAGRDHYEGRAGKNAVRVSLEQALVLQSFRADYPVQGSRTKGFLQVGNAICPRLAAHILAVTTGIPLPRELR